MEQVALRVLTDGHYRRHVERLRPSLAAAHATVIQALVTRGVEFAHQPMNGMFLWGRLPSREPVGKIWQRALDDGVLLAPGELFRPEGQATPYWRFNVARCESSRLYAFIEALRSRR